MSIELVRKIAGENNSGAIDNSFKWQEKILPVGEITTDATNFLEFSNLVVGRTYRYSGTVYLDLRDDTGAVALIREGTTDVKRVTVVQDDSVSGTNDSSVAVSFTHMFTATETTIKLRTAAFSGGATDARVLGDTGSQVRTWAVLEELPNHVEVTDFT